MCHDDISLYDYKEDVIVDVVLKSGKLTQTSSNSVVTSGKKKSIFVPLKSRVNDIIHLVFEVKLNTVRKI